MNTQKERIYRGNVENQKTDDNTWYLKLIRNPNISSNAKIVFLNIRTNGDSYNENIKSLMFKCNLSERLVSKAIKELEDLKILTRDKKQIEGRYVWLYFTNVEMLPSPLLNGVVFNGVETVPYKYNKNINKKSNDCKKENDHQSLEDKSAEDSDLQLSNKSEIDKINQALDDALFSGTFDFNPQDVKFKMYKLNQVPKIQQSPLPLNLIIETINKLPKFAEATREGFNPKGKFSDKEMFSFLKTLLSSDCEYPEWFTKSIVKNQVQDQVNKISDTWQPLTTLWGANGSRIDDSIKIMIEFIMVAVQENNKELNDSGFKMPVNRKNLFTDKCSKMLEVKKIDEIIQLMSEYCSKNWNEKDNFNSVSKAFNDLGTDAVKLNILSLAGGKN